MATDTQSTRQSQEFKNKMKVSNPLNDIAANLGVTPKVLTQLATGDDQEFRELVRGIFSILPEDEVAMVATDPSINADFLDYLVRLFEDNHRILGTILYNPSSSEQTRLEILEKFSEETVFSIARDAEAPPHVLQLISDSYKASSEILALLLANPSTPDALKESIITESSEEIAGTSVVEGRILELEEFAPEEDEFEDDKETSVVEASRDGNAVDAKIALCVDKLYDINTDIVSEFIKKARAEIVKRLRLMAKANRLILKTIVKNPSLSIEELERIDLDMFASLLKKLPEDIDDKTVLKLLKKSRRVQSK